MAIESAVVESLVSKIAELLAEPVIKQFSYMFCFNNFVEEFSEQWRSLALALHRVQHAVDVAIRNAEEIDIDVNKWLEDAKKALAVYGLQDAVDVATKNAEEIEIDVNKWLEDAKNEMEGENRLENEKGKNGKCFTWCPKWIRQFKFSKALEKKTETLRKLEEECKKFQKVAHKVPLQDIAFLPSKEFTLSESSKEAFEQIMKALKDDDVNMIGLYGMGGVGKTTLVKEVGRRAKESQLFDVVLLATVSQNPNMKNIQDQMADNLDLHFDEETTEGRVNRLRKRLTTEKKLLVILDDVWKVVKLEEIGIPVGDAHRGCKVLLTTRRRDICSYMECQALVFLNTLSENEAWALFKINAGLRDEHSNLNRVAEKVARECQGLPIALVTVGRALRGKSVVEWGQASKDLKNFHCRHMKLIGEETNTYACLKLSYDKLNCDKTKLCFLLCCLFPEDYYIPIEDLTRYAVGYELYQDVESIEDAREKVYMEINTLKDCCMLLGTETEENVKMHDLVRDVAIQIASSKEHGFMVKAGIGLKEWPMSTKSFEGCTTISLTGNKLAELPKGLVCPQLKVLLLELDDGLKVSKRFFDGMKEIEVLSLKGGCLSLQSLEFSTNLKSLLLIRCECNDLIWLRKLQRLEILGFIELSSLEELPDEIGELKELRLLDVTDCRSLGRIPVNLIGRLKKLEELLIGDDSFKGWDAVGCDSIEGTNAGLTELNSLSHLAVLSLKIPRVECIPRDFVFPRLLRYDIVLGDWYLATEHPTSTRLYLKGISAASLNAKTFEQLFPTVSQIHFIDVDGLKSIALSCDQMTSHGHGSQKDFFQCLEDVEVEGCRDTRTLFPAKWRKALNNLTNVRIEDCESLEEVFELGEAGEGSSEEKELRLLSSLTRLRLKWLRELKCIWKGPTRYVSLQSLVHLELRGLDKLTFIFTPHLAQSLVHLEKLQIVDCSGLKHLIGENDDEREIIPESLGFQKLKTLFIHGCDKLEYVFPVSVSPSLLNLEEMTIAFGDNLKQIFYSGEGDALTRDGIINLPQLRELILLRPKNFTAQLPSLQVLAIEGHEELGDLLAQLQGHTNLREIRIRDCKGAHDLMQAGHELSLLSLEKLDLSSLPDMRCIWKGLVPSHLTSLKVSRCEKLTHVFTGNMVASLVQLKLLVLLDCSELEQIIAKDNDDEKDQILSGSDLQSLCFPNLCVVKIDGCDKLRSLFPVAMASGLSKLETLAVGNSSQLLGVFGQDDHASSVNVEKQMVLPNLSFLKLDNLPSLVCFSLGCDDFLFPRLGNPMVDECPKLTTKFANKTEGHTNLREIFDRRTGHELSLLSLEKLELTSMPVMRCIWKGLVPSHLTSLKVSRCEKLTHVFTGSMVASLVQLQSLHISDCEELEQIIAKDKDDEREIIQDSLGFPKLKTLLIGGCDKLEYVFPVSVSTSLLNLEYMRIEFGANLKQIFYSGEGDALTRDGIINLPQLRELCLSSGCNFFGPKNFTAQLPSLKVLAIDGHEELGDLLAQLQGLTNLRRIYITSSKGAQHLMQAGSFVPNRRTGHEWWQALNNLTSVEIKHCESLEEVFELGEAGEGINEEKELLRLLSSLTMLELERLPELKCIWKGPTRHVSLQSLVHLELRSLHKLTFIFTLHLAQSLVHLETLRIKYCGELKHLIREKDDEREIIQESLRFPKLKTLLIRGCDKLEYVFPVSVSPSLPNLEEMEIEFGDNLKQIFYRGEGDALTRDGIINFPQQRELSLSRPTNFTVQLPSLQVLAIEGHEELGDLLAQLQGHRNLREIRITDCKGAQDRRTGHELSLLSLEKLELTSMPDMRCIWKGLVLSHLTTLEVFECHKLTHVFTGSMVDSLVQLESLHISDCEELEQIIAKDNDDEKDQILSGSDLQSLCFPNLCEVNIRGCNKLRSLFPVAMAAGLPKLKELDVGDSSQLLGVFGQDDDASPINVEKQMVLPNLSSLRLDKLPSIVCFSLGCDDFLFPRHGLTNLREIRITKCKGAQELMQVGSFGTNGRTGHELSLLSLEELSLPDMRCIWKGLVLSHLTSLKVSRCEKLTHVFTGSMVASLVQLKLLVIVACSELEQIIAKDNDDEKDQILSGSDLQSLCFPNLCEIFIMRCNKLRSLFPVAMAAGLPKLKDLDVRDSSQLLGVFGQDDEASPVNVEKQMVFPNLSSLRLYNLPSIVCFSLGCEDFLFPRLGNPMVDKCPKLTTKFANKTNASTSAQSEYLKVAEDSSTSCSEPIKVD